MFVVLLPSITILIRRIVTGVTLVPIDMRVQDTVMLCVTAAQRQRHIVLKEWRSEVIVKRTKVSSGRLVV